MIGNQELGKAHFFLSSTVSTHWVCHYNRHVQQWSYVHHWHSHTFGILAPNSTYFCGCFRKVTNSMISCLASSQPATSLQRVSPHMRLSVHDRRDVPVTGSPFRVGVQPAQCIAEEVPRSLALPLEWECSPPSALQKRCPGHWLSL